MVPHDKISVLVLRDRQARPFAVFKGTNDKACAKGSLPRDD
jgi:hypothetical protein